MVPITVFTPVYNRADLLKRCYESMCRQTNKNFIWMIIDDGSTDNTKEVVDLWILNNNGFEIQYYYKENGGLHTAYNEAIEHIDTELCVCIDSDDYMPDNAVEIILNFWKKNGSNVYAGIVGLDYTIDNHVIGDLLPDKKSINLINLLIGKYHIHNGDRTNVVRTELYKKVAPMISFKGEKNFSPHYMHLQISKNYDFLVLNKNLRYVEYQADGMSNSIFKQYLNSPNSFIETRKLYLSLPGISWKFKLRQSIHLVSSGIIANKMIEVLKYIPSFGMTVLAVPCGLLLSKYIRIKAK